MKTVNKSILIRINAKGENKYKWEEQVQIALKDIMMDIEIVNETGGVGSTTAIYDEQWDENNNYNYKYIVEDGDK